MTQSVPERVPLTASVNDDAGRDSAVDLTRGVAALLMALDHTRDFFGDVSVDPLAVDRTSPLLFTIRWITHYCAPAFVFLAGLSVRLSLTCRPVEGASRWLVVRGLYLALLELTVVEGAWWFGISPTRFELGVLWAIGWSMVVLGVLLPLGSVLVGLLGVSIVGGHNLLDGVHGSGPWEFAWAILHRREEFDFMGVIVRTYYPVGPWIGVMALGYACGGPYLRRRTAGSGALIVIGGLALGAFAVLRVTNSYGEPAPWSPAAEPWRTGASFLNVTKYPPSLQFLVVTLGLVVLTLGCAQRVPAAVSAPLRILGRVPLFFYVAHLYLIHASAAVVEAARGGQVRILLWDPFEAGFRADYGFSTGIVLVTWIVVVAAMVWLCARYEVWRWSVRDPWRRLL